AVLGAALGLHGQLPRGAAATARARHRPHRPRTTAVAVLAVLRPPGPVLQPRLQLGHRHTGRVVLGRVLGVLLAPAVDVVLLLVLLGDGGEPVLTHGRRADLGLVGR